jgi:hypothetical protein
MKPRAILDVSLPGVGGAVDEKHSGIPLWTRFFVMADSWLVGSGVWRRSSDQALAESRLFRNRERLAAKGNELWYEARYCPSDHRVYLPHD